MKKLLLDFGDRLPRQEDLDKFKDEIKRFMAGDEPVLCVWGGVKVTVVDLGEPLRKVRKVNRRRVR